MIKGLSAITKYKNGITKIKATDKLSVKSIILPDVHESDDSTINFTKRVGGEMIQCYSLSEVKLKQPDLCMPTFKEIIFKPCRASSVTTEVFCEPSIFDFDVEIPKESDFAFTTRNASVASEYNYETGEYGPQIPVVAPLSLNLKLVNPEGLWNLKINDEIIYSYDNIQELINLEKAYYDAESYTYSIRLPYMEVSNINTYKFDGKLDSVILEDYNTSNGSEGYSGFVNVTFFNSPAIKNFKFNLRGISLTVPNYLPSHIRSTERMFAATSDISSDITAWDTSNVRNMSGMFEMCQSFNQDISSWNVSAVTKMQGMFLECRSFSYDLNEWDVSNVTDMSYMFSKNSGQWEGFLKDWDTSNVTNMKGMFEQATFHQGGVVCDYWDTSSVTDMSFMFKESYYFNGNLSNWNTSNVTDMSHMFNTAPNLFSDDFGNKQHWSLAGWDTSKVTNMSHMFHNCYYGVRVGIVGWNTSKVTDMSYMFAGCKTLNHPTYWDVSNVTNMEGMFEGVALFRSDLSLWDVSKVTNMDRMFYQCYNFISPLDMWCVPLIATPPVEFITNSDMPSNNLPVWGTCPIISYKRIGEA